MTSRVVLGSILVIWCHFHKMTKMLILMELMTCQERIKLGCCYYMVKLGQVCEVPKWIYFRFIVIYIGFMTKTHFVL